MMSSGYTSDPMSPTRMPGYVHHIPYPKTPVPPEDLERFRLFLLALVDEVVSTRTLQALYIVHPFRIPQTSWREGNRKYAVCWEWGSGQAARLSEPPEDAKQPSRSSKFIEDLAKTFPDQLGSLAATVAHPRVAPGEVVHLLQKSEDFEQMFPTRRWVSPLEAFLGNGGCTLYLVQNEDSFFKLSKALTITKADPALAGLDFVVPEFTVADFANASSEALDEWFQLFDLYISENREDAGLVIASRHDIGAFISKFEEILIREEGALSSQS